MTTHIFTRRTAAATPLHVFVEDHKQPLWHAARLLGGYDAAKLVNDLAERLTREPAPASRTLRLARSLRALLRLKNVHDPDRVEAGFFACIAPTDPAVDEICLLSDELDEALEATVAAGRDHAHYRAA
ncbi:MAG: hypothetical protein ACNS61_05915 [Candidatus Wenzhouxiangella sp. M2_3B_020]